MSDDAPLDHVLRAPLPWRSDRLTECGRAADSVQACIGPDELSARIKRHGKQRAAFTVCMTCWGRVGWTSTWERHPIGVLYRELKRIGPFLPVGHTSPESERMTAELRALAALVETHREEFDGYLAGLDETVNLDQRRTRRGKRGVS